MAEESVEEASGAVDVGEEDADVGEDLQMRTGVSPGAGDVARRATLQENARQEGQESTHSL